MKNTKDLEMIIYVSDVAKFKQGINERLALDLLNPRQSRHDFIKALDYGNREFFISATSMTYPLPIEEGESIGYLLDWAELYLCKWSVEQIEGKR
jgi:hypothetical protein